MAKPETVTRVDFYGNGSKDVSTVAYPDALESIGRHIVIGRTVTQREESGCRIVMVWYGAHLSDLFVIDMTGR